MPRFESNALLSLLPKWKLPPPPDPLFADEPGNSELPEPGATSGGMLNIGLPLPNSKLAVLADGPVNSELGP